MRTWARKGIVLPLILIVVAVLFVRSDWLNRMIYPISYADEIKKSAALYQVDPLLVAAVIRVESNYRKDAVSPKGAVGIMQLMPDTAKWILQRQEFKIYSVEEAGERPDVNIRLGTWYIRELHRQFGGNLALSLAAYNAGPGTVRQWLSKSIWDGKESTLNDIPYGETRHYVQRVMYYYKKYKEIYGTL